MNTALKALTAAGLLASIAGVAAAQNGTIVFSEDFETVVLGDSVDELLPGIVPASWTPNLPAGWARDNSGVPSVGNDQVGVLEWEGWSLATIDFWALVGGSNRDEFGTNTAASNIVAIADGDEWNDLGDPTDIALMNTFLATPAINVAADADGSVTLNFASSWRAEDFQTASITVSFDGGAKTTVLEWDSAGNALSPVADGGAGSQIGFKDDNVDENISLAINVPAGATNMVVEFGYTEGDDDWWWALDNIQVTGTNGQLFFEDFEGLAGSLMDSVDELSAAVPYGVLATNVWADAAIAAPSIGWTADDSGVPSINDPDGLGITEWEGWAFADVDFWLEVAGDQGGRQAFAEGFAAGSTVIIADPDEWDDNGIEVDGETISPDDLGNFDGFITTPEIALGNGVLANTLTLTFASSWRDEDTQRATVEVSYDSGANFTEILNWNSNSADTDVVAPAGVGDQVGFKNDAPNEFVVLNLDNAADVTSVMFRFGMVEGRNDWWWAIDNVQVAVTNDLGSSAGSFLPGGFLVQADDAQATAFPEVALTNSAGATSFNVSFYSSEDLSPESLIETVPSAGGVVTATTPFINGRYFVTAEAANTNGTTAAGNVVSILVDNPNFPDLNQDGNLDAADINLFLDYNAQ